MDLDTSGSDWVATVDLETTASGGFPEDYTVWVAFSDDRDFRRTSDPIQSRPRTPCIDSDPNDPSSDEDVFIAVTPISVVPAGSQRVITFTPPAEMASFTDPLTAVIVEAWFEGPHGTEIVDDLLVTTYPRFVNDELYKASIEDCQGKDGLDLLHVNGDTGATTDRTVLVEESGPMTLGIDLPPAGGNGKFLALIEADAPSSSSIVKLTNQLGDTCFPMLLNDGAAPLARYNSIGKEDKVGSSEYFGVPIADPGRAPTTFLDLPVGDPANFSVGQVFTLHGVILNPAVTGAKPASITNSIQIVIY